MAFEPTVAKQFDKTQITEGFDDDELDGILGATQKPVEVVKNKPTEKRKPGPQAKKHDEPEATTTFKMPALLHQNLQTALSKDKNIKYFKDMMLIALEEYVKNHKLDQQKWWDK